MTKSRPVGSSDRFWAGFAIGCAATLIVVMAVFFVLRRGLGQAAEIAVTAASSLDRAPPAGSPAPDQSELDGVGMEPEARVPEPGVLDCSPRTLGAHDTMTVRLPRDHGRYLAVYRLDGKAFMLAYPSLGDTTGPAPVFDESAYAAVDSVRLPRSLMAETWQHGSWAPEPVFAAPGVYEVIAGQNLESDAGYPAWSCRIKVEG